MVNNLTVKQLQEVLDEKCYIFGVDKYKITEYINNSNLCQYIVYGLAIEIEDDIIMFTDLECEIQARLSILMMLLKKYFVKIKYIQDIISIDFGCLGYITIEEIK